MRFAEHDMAKVVYLDPIDHISGKISRKHRTVYYYRAGTGAKYTSIFTTPTGTPTAAQQACTAKFRQAAQQTNTIMMDVTAVEPYRTAWRNLIRSGNTTYKTLRGYIFSQIYRTL